MGKTKGKVDFKMTALINCLKLLITFLYLFCEGQPAETEESL